MMNALAMQSTSRAQNSNIFAFFDVDDTLITVKSVFCFQDFWFDRENDPQGKLRFYQEMDRLRAENAPWEFLNRRLAAVFAGRSVALTEARAEEWFQSLVNGVEPVFHMAVVERLRSHQRRGHQPVFVSGSFPPLLAPIARRLNVEYILAAALEEKDGVYTGELLPPQTIGDGKALALRSFAQSMGIHTDLCYAYGDDITDVPMLAAVGRPTAIAGGRGLEQYAAQAGWPVLSPF